MVRFLPKISDRCDQKKTPKNIPNGYAEVSSPKDALPRFKEKCCPKVGIRGEHMVKPRSGKKETRRRTMTDCNLFSSVCIRGVSENEVLERAFM
jgi:hypothetical protein